MSGSGDSNNSGRSPAIPPKLSLKEFRFTTIGKEPALLARMFDSATPIRHDQDDIYEDHLPLPPNPSHSVTENHANSNGGCTRRSLLETLGGDADVTQNVLHTERSAMNKVERNNTVPPTATPHQAFTPIAFPPNSNSLGSSYVPDSASGSSASSLPFRASHNTKIVGRPSDRGYRAHSVPRSFSPDDDPFVSSDEEPTLADLRCLQERLAATISNLRPIDNSRAVKLVSTLKDQCKTVFTTARQSQRLARQALDNAQQAVASSQICLSVAESIQPHANEVLSAVRRLGHCHGDRGPGREWNSLLEGLEDNLQQLEQWAAKREAYEMRREVEEREAELSRMQLPRSALRNTGMRPLSLSPPVTSTNRAPDADITMTSVGEKAEGRHGAWSRQVPEPSAEDDIRKRNRANLDFQDVGEKPTVLLESAKRNSEAKTTRQSEEDQTVQSQLEMGKELERKNSEVLKRQLRILDEEKQRQGLEDFEASKRQQAEAELETAKRPAESERKHLEAEAEAAKRLQEEQGLQENQQQPPLHTENSNAGHRGKEKEIPLADNGVTPHILGKTASPVSLLRPVRLISTLENSKIGNVTSKKTLADYFGHDAARQRKKANKPHVAPLQVVSNTEAVSTPPPSQDGQASDSGHHQLPSVADNQLTHSPSPLPANNDPRLSPLLPSFNTVSSSTGIQHQQQAQPIALEKQPVPLSTTSHASITQTETEACQSRVDMPPPAAPQKVHTNVTDFDMGNVVMLRAKIISPKAQYRNWKRIRANAGLLDTLSIKPEPVEQKAKLNTEENEAHTPPRTTLNSSMSLPPNAEVPADVAAATVKPELEHPLVPQTLPPQAKLKTISLENVSRAKSPVPGAAISVSTTEQNQRTGDNPLTPPQRDRPSSISNIIPSAPSISTGAPLNIANTEAHSPNPPETVSLFDRMQCSSIPSNVLHPSPSSESRIIISTQSPPVASPSTHGPQHSSTVPLVLRVEQPDHPYMQDPDEQMGPDLMTSSWNDQGDDMHDERHQFQSRLLEDNRRSRSPPPPSVVKRLPSRPGIELLKHNPYVPARRCEPSPPLHRGRRRSFSGTGSINSGSRDVSSNPRSHAVSPNSDSRATSSNPQKSRVSLNPESHGVVSNSNSRKSKSPGSRFSVSPSRPIAGQKRMREDDSVPGPSPRRSRNRGPSHSAPFASRYANTASGSSQVNMGDGVAMRMEHPGSFQERSNYLNNRQPPGQPLLPRMNPSSQSPERRMQPTFRPLPHQNWNRHYDNNASYIPQQPRGRDNHTPDLLNRISDSTDIRPHSQPNSGRQHVQRRPFNRGRGRGRGRGGSTGGVGVQRGPGNPPALIDRFQDS